MTRFKGPALLKYLSVLWLFFLAQAQAIDVVLEGINDDALAANIEAHMSNLDVRKRCEASADLSATVDARVQTASQAMGYYHVELLNLGFSESQECDELTLTLVQGPPVVVKLLDIQLEGEAKNDPEFQALLQKLPLVKNQTLLHYKYEATKRSFESLAQARGYFDAKFDVQRLEIDTQSNSAVVRLTFNGETRYQFGEVLGTQDLRTNNVIHSIKTFSPGQPYHASQLGKFNQNLKLTGYFQQVVARPLVKEAHNYQVPIEVIATSKPRDVFNVGGGASTDTQGLRFKLNWQRPWVNSYGHSMSADLFVSKPRQALSFRYKIPVEDPLDNFFTLQAGYKAEDDNDTKSNTLTLAAQRHWATGEREWNKIAFLRYERETFEQADEPEQTTDLLIPGFTLSRHRSRGGLDVNWGDQQLFTIEVADDAVISDIDLIRVTVQTKWLRSIEQHRVFMRAKFGALATNNFTEVPSSLRYFAGGDQSVRGFGYQELGPRESDDKDADLVGGRYLSTGSIEYSYPVGQGWRMAVFADVGNASNEPFKDLAYSSGIGASWQSPVGPIRLYLARGFSDYENTFRIHFAMGPVL